MENRIRTIEELPLVLKADDIASAMGISRAFAYQLLRSKGFPTIYIGRRMVVYRESFIKWLENQAN